jgi:hypothetical protein
MLDAINAYLKLLGKPPEDRSKRLLALAEVLDRLAMAYHQTPDVESEAQVRVPDGATSSYQELRAEIGPQFPDLGLYATIEPGDPDKLDGMVGDAIDDLADIAGDLQEVIWRAENVGTDDAAWHFRFGYLSHWGQHLMELRGHVHYLLREQLI